MADLKTRLDEPAGGRAVDEVPGPGSGAGSAIRDPDDPVTEPEPDDPVTEPAPDDPATGTDTSEPGPTATTTTAVAGPALGAEPDPPAEAAVPTSATAHTPPGRWTVLVACMAGLLILLTAVDGLLYVEGGDPAAGLREPALDAARQVALDLSTLGTDNVDAKLPQLTESTTGPFREEVTGYADYLREIRKQGQLSSAGTVTAAGIERIDAERALALVAVSTTGTDVAEPDGQERRYRLAVELHREGGRWLATAVAFVA